MEQERKITPSKGRALADQGITGTEPSPRWIPAAGLGGAGGEKVGGASEGSTLVAGFLTALPRLPDRELAARVAPLMAREGSAPTASLEPLLLRQVHSAEILDSARLDEGRRSAEGDSTANGHAYDTEGHSAHTGDGAVALASRPRWLGVKTADCVPLLAVAEGGRIYAALHVGWRGAAAGIVVRLLERWLASAPGGGAGNGVRLESVRLALGPHIGACCYEVGHDCLEQFEQGDLAGAVLSPGGDVSSGAVSSGGSRSNPHLDLAAVIRNQAQRLGVPAPNIQGSAWCTRCHDPATDGLHFASYRAAVARGETLAHTNLAVIGIR